MYKCNYQILLDALSDYHGSSRRAGETLPFIMYHILVMFRKFTRTIINTFVSRFQAFSQYTKAVEFFHIQTEGLLNENITL